MSRFSDDFAASAGAAMLAYQGDSITRITSGGSSSTVTAIVSDENMGGDEVETDSGLVRIRIKSLQVAASQTTAIDDTWTISGERWACTGMTAAHDGLKVVTVRRTDRVASQSSARRGG
jgi:hypothetical protein